MLMWRIKLMSVAVPKSINESRSTYLHRGYSAVKFDLGNTALTFLDNSSLFVSCTQLVATDGEIYDIFGFLKRSSHYHKSNLKIMVRFLKQFYIYIIVMI